MTHWPLGRVELPSRHLVDASDPGLDGAKFLTKAFRLVTSTIYIYFVPIPKSGLETLYIFLQFLQYLVKVSKHLDNFMFNYTCYFIYGCEFRFKF